MNGCNKQVCDRELTSQGEVAPVKRACNGFAPVGIRWCRRKDGWPANSVVYTDCAFYWTQKRNFKDPDYEGSGWVAFDAGGMMRRVLAGYDFKGYDCTKLDYKMMDCITDCGKWRMVTKVPVTTSPDISDRLPESDRQWSAPMDMCELIKAFDTNGHVKDNGDGTFTFFNSDGTEGVSWVGSQHPDDVYITNVVIDEDAGTITYSYSGDVPDLVKPYSVECLDSANDQLNFVISAIDLADIPDAYNDFVNPKVVATEVYTRADFPDLPDCHNSVELAFLLDNQQDPGSVYLKLAAGWRATGAVMRTRGNTCSTGAGSEDLGRESTELTVTVPFDANGEIKVEHILYYKDANVGGHIRLVMLYLGSGKRWINGAPA